MSTGTPRISRLRTDVGNFLVGMQFVKLFHLYSRRRRGTRTPALRLLVYTTVFKPQRAKTNFGRVRIRTMRTSVGRRRGAEDVFNLVLALGQPGLAVEPEHRRVSRLRSHLLGRLERRSLDALLLHLDLRVVVVVVVGAVVVDCHLSGQLAHYFVEPLPLPLLEGDERQIVVVDMVGMSDRHVRLGHSHQQYAAHGRCLRPPLRLSTSLRTRRSPLTISGPRTLPSDHQGNSRTDTLGIGSGVEVVVEQTLNDLHLQTKTYVRIISQEKNTLIYNKSNIIGSNISSVFTNILSSATHSKTPYTFRAL